MFKRVLKKVVAVLSAVLIVVSSFALVSICAGAVYDVWKLVGFVTDQDYIDFIDDYIKSASGLTDEEWITTYFEDYYAYLVDDHFGLATGSGGIYGSDNNFNQKYLDDTYQQLAMFFAGNGIPFDWDEFCKYAKARRSAELSSQSFSSSDYVASNDLHDIKLSGAGFKALNDSWSEYYKPHANSQQYIVSYQTQGMTDTSFDRLKKGAILYGDVNSWGNKQWDTVYVLPFVQDDFGGTYYCNSYFHFYSTRDDDVKFNRDFVQIDSGKVTSSNSCLWADNTYFAIYWYKANTGQIWVTGWKDFYSYNSATSVYATLPQMMDFRFVNADWNEVYPNQVYESSSFTPWNNKNDDIGFILSSEPFELVSNQTKIDYDKIPDNYTITITGDTIYDYDITNPDTGDHSTVNNYITNNYTIPGGKNDDDDPSSGGGSGTISGDVTVGGKVDVSGKIEIDTKPIDININVNTSGSASEPDSSPSSSESDPSGSGTIDIPAPTLEGLDDSEKTWGNLIDFYKDASKDVGGLFSGFMAIIPDPIANMIPLAVGAVIFIGLVKALR